MQFWITPLLRIVPFTNTVFYKFSFICPNKVENFTPIWKIAVDNAYRWNLYFCNIRCIDNLHNPDFDGTFLRDMIGRAAKYPKLETKYQGHFSVHLAWQIQVLEVRIICLTIFGDSLPTFFFVFHNVVKAN